MKSRHAIASFILISASIQFSVCLKSDNIVNTTQFQSCACDMTKGFCDVYCCCDEDCTEFHKESFECHDIKLPTVSEILRCDYIKGSPESGFSQLLCLHKENTPYLGHYFDNFDTIKDLPSLNDLLSKKAALHPNQEDYQSRKTDKYIDFGLRSGYFYGQELSIVSKRFSTSSLRIPYSSFGRVCDSYRLVGYLKDIQSTCLTNVESECMSLAHAESFLVGEHAQKLLGAPQDETPVQDITVRYYYIPEACCYLYSEECIRNNITNCDRQPYEYILKSHKAESCLDIVLEAHYVFHWSGGHIHKIDVDIMLGNVSATRGTLRHKFSVSFRYLNENFTRDRIENHRFALPLGYKINDYINGYKDFEDILTDENTSIPWTWIWMWSGGIDGSCRPGSTPIEFGVQRLSGCTFVIEDPARVQCSSLRSDIRELQMTVLDVTSLDARGGNNGNFTVEIIEDDIQITNDTEPGHRGGCSGIPHHVTLEVIYAEIGRDGGQPVYQILRAVRRFKTVTWYYDDSSNAAVQYSLYSSVNFQMVSVEEMERQKRTKRSKLQPAGLDLCPGETCWDGVLYPLLSSDFQDEILSQAANVLFMVVVILSSAMFLFGIGRQGKRET